MGKTTLEVSWSTLWRIFFFVLIAAVLISGLQIIMGLFLAIVISSGLESIVNFLEKKGLPRLVGVISVFLFLLLLLVIVVYFVIPFIIADLQSLVASINQTPLAPWLSPIINLKTTQSASALINRISSQLFQNASPLDTLSQIVGSVGLAVAVIVSSFYLTISRDGVERFIKAVFPGDEEESTLKIYERSKRKIGAWFRTQIILSLSVGFLVWIALSLLGVKHVFVLSLLAAIFELVPFVGPILAGAVSTLFALTTSVSLALYTLIVFTIIHQLEANILVPLLIRRAVGLHPVLVIISLLLGIELGGILGVIVAVPLAAVIEEFFEERSLKKLQPVTLDE